jgi:hypothetical protein
MKFLKWFFGLFSPYVNSFERRVDKFFGNVKSTDSISTIRVKLLELMKENLIVVNIWLEKKFKGYVYLSKKVRRKMYLNVLAIVGKFKEYSSSMKSVEDDYLKKMFDERGLLYPHGDENKIRYLYEIMQFLKPGLHYQYIKTASFGKLLRDPNKEKLEGDCNQIVTLYIYLYSLKFPVEDLEIKLLPEHVCLHFRSVDIEATNGTFQKYKDSTQILPVTEIISTNLLDLADFREDTQVISDRVMVKSAQLAYAISSLRVLVAKNLDVAYRNLAVSALKSNNFATARYYADLIGDRDFSETVRYNEGIHYYKNDKIDKALSVFSSLGDEKMKKACYAKQYNNLLKKVSGDKTILQVKTHKSVYQGMLLLAQKMGDSDLERRIRDTLGKV